MVLVFQFFFELIPDMIPHARPGAVEKLPNAGWRFPEESLEKNSESPIQINGIGARQHRISRGRARKEGLWIPTTNTHLMDLTWKCATVLNLPEEQKCLWRLVINIRHHEFDGKPWVLHPLYRYQKNRTWHPHCVWSFKGSSVPRRRQAGRADVEKTICREVRTAITSTTT